MRPSFVLGGRGMVIVYKEKYLRKFVEEAAAIGEGKPILIDRFLEDATELDVDCISDGKHTVGKSLGRPRRSGLCEQGQRPERLRIQHRRRPERSRARFRYQDEHFEEPRRTEHEGDRPPDQRNIRTGDGEEAGRRVPLERPCRPELTPASRGSLFSAKG